MSNQANFLYEWGKRRERGLCQVLALGAGIGAAGGVLFSVLMAAASPDLQLAEDEMAPFLLLLGRALGPVPFLFLISTVSFAGLGVFLAFTVWGMMEARYRALISAGVRPAAQRPVYTLKERAPGFVVIGVFALLVLGLLYALWREVQQGTL